MRISSAINLNRQWATAVSEYRPQPAPTAPAPSMDRYVFTQLSKRYQGANPTESFFANGYPVGHVTQQAVDGYFGNSWPGRLNSAIAAYPAFTVFKTLPTVDCAEVWMIGLPESRRESASPPAGPTALQSPGAANLALRPNALVMPRVNCGRLSAKYRDPIAHRKGRVKT